jgi:hypothetical protein
MKKPYITAQEAVNLIKDSFPADAKVTGIALTTSDGEQKKFGTLRAPAADAEFIHRDELKDGDE